MGAGRIKSIQEQFIMCFHLSRILVDGPNMSFLSRYSFTLAHSVRVQNKHVSRAIHLETWKQNVVFWLVCDGQQVRQQAILNRIL